MSRGQPLRGPRGRGGQRRPAWRCWSGRRRRCAPAPHGAPVGAWAMRPGRRGSRPRRRRLRPGLRRSLGVPARWGRRRRRSAGSGRARDRPSRADGGDPRRAICWARPVPPAARRAPASSLAVRAAVDAAQKSGVRTVEATLRAGSRRRSRGSGRARGARGGVNAALAARCTIPTPASRHSRTSSRAPPQRRVPPPPRPSGWIAPARNCTPRGPATRPMPRRCSSSSPRSTGSSLPPSPIPQSGRAGRRARTGARRGGRASARGRGRAGAGAARSRPGGLPLLRAAEPGA